jgi:glycolate oxidase FAD binding subunit
MTEHAPSTPEQCAEALATAQAARHTIRCGGRFSKDRMAGLLAPCDVTLSTHALNRVLVYDPRDLTISVEAGLPWRDLTALLAEQGQMIPLDPPLADSGTVGGVVAANLSGPRRRQFGTARDVIIGMKFATLEGKVVQSGGMVVKNVAGLDMAKLFVGSFGTLAVMTSVNFKVSPLPKATLSLAASFATAESLFAARDQVLQGVLQPMALDALNPAAAERLGLSGFTLLLEAGGNAQACARFRDAVPGAAEVDPAIWTRVREFSPTWPGTVWRVSSSLSAQRDLVGQSSGPVLARAGSGVTYVCAENPPATGQPCVEWRPTDGPAPDPLWPAPGSDFPLMESIKNLFDPHRLLNPGRLYGRL